MVERRVESVNYMDHNGRSVGGNSRMEPHVRIVWFGEECNGMSSRDGAFVEDVLMAARDRLEFFQRTVTACPENIAAIAHINSAMAVLAERKTRIEAEKAALKED